MTTPTLRIDVSLVPHGYQVDIYNGVFAQAGQGPIENANGVAHQMWCGSFADSHDEAVMADLIAKRFLDALRGIEPALLARTGSKTKDAIDARR